MGFGRTNSLRNGIFWRDITLAMVEGLSRPFAVAKERLRLVRFFLTLVSNSPRLGG